MMPPLPPPADLKFPFTPLFSEHFPGAPCLPGSCLLEAVRRAAECAFQCRVTGLPQARFRRFVTPDQPCRLYWLPRAEAHTVGWQLCPLPEAQKAPASPLADGLLRLESALPVSSPLARPL